MALMPKEGRATLAAPPVMQRWYLAGGCLVAVAVLLGLIFAGETEGAYHVWLTSTAYNHCFLIAPVAGYLAWQRRDALAALDPQPDFRPLLLLLPVSALWLVAAILSVLELQQLLVLAMFQIAAASVLGLRVYRALLTPFLYLFFLVPAGYFLVPYLQDFTARFIVAGLELLRIPVFSDGTMIEAPSGNFVVAEACAGLRFLIASVAFGVLFATLVYRSWWRRFVFVALSIVVPVLANGMRGLGLILLSEWSGSTTAVMADHIIYGWLFFSFVTGLLIVIGMLFSDGHDGGIRMPSAIPAAAAPAWRVVLVAGLSLALAGAGPAYATLRESTALAMQPDQAPPPVPAAWRQAPGEAVLWEPLIVATDRAYHDAYSDGAGTVIRYVALYATGGRQNNLVRGKNEVADPELWHIAGRGTAHVTIAGRDATVASTEIKMDTHRLLVWSFYALGDRVVATPLQAKLAQLRSLFGHQSLTAFVAVAADANDHAHPAPEVLGRFLGTMAPLGPYLAGTQVEVRQ